MISYAPTGGSVGPHVDNYDVFLLQASGSRLWKTAYTPISAHEEELVPGLDVRILRGAFPPDEQWVLEPGDALYVPPRFPHHGVSLSDDCVTYSIGFRAPSMASLMSGWVSNVVQEQRLWEQLLHEDGADLLQNVSDPARLTDATVQNAFDKLFSKLGEDKAVKQQFRRWFATHLSQLGEPNEEDMSDDDEVEHMMHAMLKSAKIDNGLTVRQREGSTFIYVADGDKCSMYIDGEEWHVKDVNTATFVCGRRSRNAVEYAELCQAEPSFEQVLRNLLIAGVLYVDDGMYSDETEADVQAE
ncbi:Cupin protein [Gracilaria domingensis]|nr:Cupin protein [Gracilaria domingensis]